MENRFKKSEKLILRQKALGLLKNKISTSNFQHDEVDELKLIHERCVHQIELELQNEELELTKTAAQNSSAKYIKLYDFAPTGYFTLSPEGQIIELNLNGAHMIGKERSKLLSSLFGFFISEETKPVFNFFLREVFNSNVNKSCEVILINNSGQPINVYFTGITIGNGERCHVNVIDITRIKEVEQALILANKALIFQSDEREKRAAELIIANKELTFQNEEKAKRATELIIANKELTFQNEEKAKRAAELIIANKELTFLNEEKAKRAAELIIANKELTFQNEEKAKRATELIIANKELTFQNEEKAKRAAELIIANKELTFQNEEKAKRATELIIANHKALENEEKANLTAKLIIANKGLAYQSLENKKRADELTIAYKVLADQNIEKEKQAAELIIAKNYAEESDLLKSAFLANMSHEIRTPMNGILGFTELLKKPNLTAEKQIKYISMIEKGGERMLNIINDLIDISKIQSGQTSVLLSACNVNDQIEFIYTFFKPEVERKGMQIYFQNGLPLNEAVIETDCEKFYAILTNLVKNAIKYSNSGSIELGYYLKQTQETFEFVNDLPELTFFVKDSGIGIPLDKQGTIFERFIQVDSNNNRVIQGAGLGLSIAKAFVEMLGGKIWVESEPGYGSTFYFTIPYHNVHEEKKIIKKVIPLEETDSQIKKLNIIIAEDDESSAMLQEEIVRGFSKKTLLVSTGAEAVDALHNDPEIDLILMDINMPVMNGLMASSLIRQFNKKVIIIAQSASTLNGEREQAKAAGCNDYIPKPLNHTFMKELIKKQFNK